MKQKLYAVMAGSLALTAVLGSCGGGGGTGNSSQVQIDPTKTQVYVSVFNGGFGIDWLNEAANRFMEKNTEVQIILNPNKDIYQTQIAPAIEAGISASDVFISAQPSCQDLGLKGYLEDLTDIWQADVDGNGKTVEEKMKDTDLFKKVYQVGDGTWGLPHSDAMQGFVYDHSIFVNKGYLMTQADGETLTVGKDGKPGTYDDGQPTTIAEWDLMIQRMVSDGVYPFFWTGMYAADYLGSLPEALLTQYDGFDSYIVSQSYNGVYKHADGTQETITPETGYKTIKTPSKKVIADFMYKYFVENANYYHPSSKYNSVSHTDAQALFVLGYNPTTANPQSGMLYEGCWWENEARATFVSLEKRGETDYKYGTRDYRYMLLPDLPGQRGAFGDGTGSAMGVGEMGTIFMKKVTDEKKRTFGKEFIKYLMTDEVSRLFTAYACGLRPYEYDLKAEDYNNMSLFAKNAYEVYSDTENVKIVRNKSLKYLSEMNHMTTEVVSRWGSTAGGRSYTNAYTAVCNVSPEEFYNGMDNFENTTYWKKIYDQYLALFQ